MGLGIELEHAITGLGQSTGAADDALQLQASDQRRDGHAVRGDRGDVDGLGGRAEIQTPDDDRGAGDIRGRGHDARRADGQDARRAGAGGSSRAEGVDLQVARTSADIIEDQTGQGVVAEKIQVTDAVHRDDVSGGDLAGDGVGRATHGHRSVVDGQPIGRGRGQRDGNAGGRGQEVDRASVDHGAAGVASGRIDEIDASAGGSEDDTQRRS